MIDKSIRQHYQNGEKVDVYTAGKKTIWPALKEQIKSQALPEKGKLPNIIRAPLQRTALNKLGLGALNPILGLLSLFGIDPFRWAGRKLTEGGVKQAFTAGMLGSPAEGRELSQLEARRANLLRRKEEGKSYSKKNLEEVTNRINEITRPYDYQDAKTVPQRKQVIDQLYEFEGKKTAPLRKIPTVEDTAAMEDIITRPTVEDTAAMEDILTRPTVEKTAAMEDIITQTEAAAIKAEIDRQQKEKDAAAAVRARATVSVPVPRHISHGGRDRGGNGGGQAAADAAGGSAYSSPFAKGGRVDKALGGRSRDI
jgi:hypothetical protein